MTIKELIEELKKFDENLVVCITDSEYGLEEIGGTIQLCETTHWIGADHFPVPGIEIK